MDWHQDTSCQFLSPATLWKTAMSGSLSAAACCPLPVQVRHSSACFHSHRPLFRPLFPLVSAASCVGLTRGLVCGQCVPRHWSLRRRFVRTWAAGWRRRRAWQALWRPGERRQKLLNCFTIQTFLLLLFLITPDTGSTQMQWRQTAKIQNVNTNPKSKNTELK